jgi:hypothetical protein
MLSRGSSSALISIPRIATAIPPERAVFKYIPQDWPAGIDTEPHQPTGPADKNSAVFPFDDVKFNLPAARAGVGHPGVAVAVGPEAFLRRGPVPHVGCTSLA